MRIDPNVVVSPIQLDTAKPRAGGSTPPSTGGDVVQLSAAASAASHGTQPTNAERLDKIRALLSAGEYAVDLDQLASRIVDDDIARSRKLQ